MARKKTFRDDMNPTLQFITLPEEETSTPSEEDAPEGYKVNPLYVEKKSRRLQLLLQPSLYRKLKRRADSEGESINNLVHLILEEALGE